MGFGLKKLTGRVIGAVASLAGKKPEEQQPAPVAPNQTSATVQKPEEKKKPRGNNMGTILAGEAAGPTSNIEKKTLLGG
jgi:hypothetical protein